MQKVLVFCVVLILTERANCLRNDHKYFVTSAKGLDYKFAGEADEHRYGVEIKENNQFHHTITAPDGVRLGCYGYETDGRKFSTNYIADGKGYRLAPNQDLITVYPKDGTEPRKASFTGSFGDEVKDDNVRYVFPSGCEAPKQIVDQSGKKSNSRQGIIDALSKNLAGNTARRSRNRNLAQTTATTSTTTMSTTTTTEAPTTTENNQSQEDTTTPESRDVQTRSDDTSENSGGNDLDSSEKDNSESDDQGKNDIQSDEPGADDEEKGGCCKSDGGLINLSCSKILIPINKEKLSLVPASEITALSSLKSTLSVLQALQKLARKYGL